MTVTFTATPELDLARVAIRAEGGVVGDSFYVLRRDRSGSNMVRETSEAGVTWTADPAATKTNQHTNPRFATVSGLTELRRNLATNPRCAPSTTATERRRNLVAESSMEGGGIGEEYFGGSGTNASMFSGGAHGANYRRQTWTTAGGVGGGMYLPTSWAALPGRVYYLQSYVRSSIAQKMAVGVDWRNSGGSIIGNSQGVAQTLTPYNSGVEGGTQWTKLTGFVIAPPNTVNGTVTVFAQSGGLAWSAGSWLDVDSTLAEFVDASKRPYRINRATDPSFENGLATITQLPGCVASSSTAWFNSGTKSIKLTPDGTTVDSSTAINGDTGAFRMGMYPGGTFTASAYFRQAAPQSAPGSFARLIKLYYKSAGGTYIEVSSPAAANTTAVQRVSVTQTIPADATEAFVRIYCGSQNAADAVWWDDFQLEDGSAMTSFLRGNQTPGTGLQIGFIGAADASATVEAPAVIEHFDGSVGVLTNNGGEDLVASWTGSVGNSQSILTSRNVPLYTPGAASIYAARNGTAIAIIPTGANAFAAIDGDTGANRLGMVASKTYTARATISVPRVQVSTGTWSRKIVAYTKVGAAAYVETHSNQAPNAVGDYELTVKFTTPAGMTECFIRLFNGSSDPNDVVIYSKIQVMEKDGAYFDGATVDTADLDYSWAGTADASASIQKGKIPTGASGNASIVYSSTESPQPGMANFARWEVWSFTAQGFYVQDIPAVGQSPSGPKTGILWVRSKKNVTVQPRWRTTAAVTVTAGPPIALVANVWTEIRHYDAAAPADSGFGLLITPGTDMLIGDTLDIGQHAVINGDWTGQWFDGSSEDPAYSGWNGVAHASTSYFNTAALPITVYDYEARQGLETSYALTSDAGIIGEFLTINIPNWGSWLKDPFRPFMNVKILWNSDSVYTRKSDRVLLKPKGARFPVPQWDQREAPEGTVRVATETNEQSRNLVALLDGTGVIMVDVPEEYGVPVRYVSVGDYAGMRVGAEDRDLTWEARYFDLSVNEIATPVGEPVGQEISYESVGNFFGSYLALAASAETYDELAAGTWNQDV